ncbi:WcaF family extracellular polysaccharide biosynthesis acetyltransferase [Lacibacter sp. MH-610]|uniref:WcaF family extracellular polysaccharide biosynthesis acetyltransferase n=1 Tax=Lacibacter sp. MH-610 TaxID=3020883 RepID=UPI0038919636
MMQTRLDQYNNSWYKPGRSVAVRMLWHCTSVLLVQCSWNLSSAVRTWCLRLFGASIGKGVVIKPGVQIKYPWLLKVGNHVWIGEHVWIDNLTTVTIDDHVCISQGAYLLTGNHDYTSEKFNLMVKPIMLQQGVWIGAKAIVGPGVTAAPHAVLTAGSVATKDLEAFKIHSGNPALPVKERVFRQS